MHNKLHLSGEMASQLCRQLFTKSTMTFCRSVSLLALATVQDNDFCMVPESIFIPPK